MKLKKKRKILLCCYMHKPTSLILFYMDPEFQCMVSFVLGGRGGLAKMITSFVFWATLNFINGP